MHFNPITRRILFFPYDSSCEMRLETQQWFLGNRTFCLRRCPLFMSQD